MARVKLGTSLRFLFPTSPQTHEAFRRALAAAPAGSFIERPIGAYDTAEQARNWLEVAAAARAASLDGLLVGDNFVGDSDVAAAAVVDPILAEGYRGTGRDTLLVGGPATVVQQLREYAAMGFGHVMVRHITGDHARMLESFDRIGRHVIPAIRDL